MCEHEFAQMQSGTTECLKCGEEVTALYAEARTLLAAKERRIERMGAALQMARLYFVDHSMEAMQIDRALSTPSTETEGDL